MQYKIYLSIWEFGCSLGLLFLFSFIADFGLCLPADRWFSRCFGATLLCLGIIICLWHVLGIGQHLFELHIRIPV